MRDRGLGGEQVEGRRAVRELLAAGRRRTRDVWITEGPQRSALVDEIAELAESARVPVRRVGAARLQSEARTVAPQGVLAHADPVPEVAFDAMCRTGGEGRPFLLALDGMTDPQNLGGLLRSAEGAGVTGVVLPRHRAVHITPAVTKAAAGAIEHVRLAVVPGLPAAIRTAASRGLWVVGLDPAGQQSLFELELAAEPLVVVVGAEGSGLSRLVAERCDVLARIPLRGRLESLNAAAAGAVALFDVSRRRAT